MSQPPAEGSSRTFTVVLLSLLILTVIGALFGYVLGRRDIDENKSAGGNGPSAVSSGGAKAASGDPCPEFIGKAAKAKDSSVVLPLRQVQYIRTKGRREVWICQEADQGGLWYQGHEYRTSFYDDGEVPVEGDNGLLLGGVTAQGVGNWVAVNGKTNYRVSRQSLTVTGNQNYVDPVIQANPR